MCRAVLVTRLTGALLVTGMTALMEAAKRGRTSMVEFFLSHDPHMPLKVSCISIYTEKHIEIFIECVTYVQMDKF